MNLLYEIIDVNSTLGRIIFITVIALGAHLAVIIVKRIGRSFLVPLSLKSNEKAVSLFSLLKSFLIFFLYFGAFGLILNELGVSLTAYLASASVIGLAVGFGSQGLVQDLVTGLSLVLSDLIHVGDMVEIGGQTGVISSIGMRFIVLKNQLGADVYIPNRSVNNVINYPRGYVRCLVDALLLQTEDAHSKTMTIADSTMNAFVAQFPGIHIRPPGIEGVFETTAGRKYIRIKFRIWPGRGAPIETFFRQELVYSMRRLDPSYSDVMVTVNYEVEQHVLTE